MLTYHRYIEVNNERIYQRSDGKYLLFWHEGDPACAPPGCPAYHGRSVELDNLGEARAFRRGLIAGLSAKHVTAVFVSYDAYVAGPHYPEETPVLMNA